MAIVTEFIDAYPSESTAYQVKRNEELLLQQPEPSHMKLWRDYDLLGALHFPLEYKPAKFSPPRDVYGGDFMRIEWQQMDFRQPFYHRNADVDEISYQVCGSRILMTELGSVDLLPGDFARIPVAVAHDNYGRNDIHLLFYIHGPAKECGKVSNKTELKLPPFEGWESKTVTELMTECLGARGCDISVSLADETLLLNRPEELAMNENKINVFRAEQWGPETEWLYKSEHVWIGTVRLDRVNGNLYHRHRQAEAIQIQLSGHRTLISQRGVIELEPGDFVSIPRGCSYTSVTTGESIHISVLTAKETPPKAVVTKKAKPTTAALVAEIREMAGRK